MNNFNSNTRRDVTGRDEGMQAFFQKMYSYMSIALLVTGVTGYIVQSFFLQQIVHLLAGSVVGLLFILALEFIIVFMMRSASVQNPARAFGLLMAFSVIQGLTLGLLLAVYTTASVIIAFVSTAAVFASMAAYGYLTNRSLNSLGSILFGALIGLIIASLANIFFVSNTLSLIISAVSVIVFAIYTAYDNNRLKDLYVQMAGEGQTDMTGLAVNGALMLYLDFINMFYALIRLTGDSRQ
ncbi:Bax inhibitor-1/YccA family protein [Convivina praedatoris]|uniref:Inner membrane protein YbhL n=1 Tax=Convivina praedatoris TaxID=2880963 RepID=A0ABM9CZN0_9LACO|nr:Bax inhibitor-1/YccA family protein [Convivina sp. LMG 32447]CAH1849977.1 Inner membrane protein YbhL [Convivina sp. LMG 32447]CAH1849979.1 Inner membrane protein YbhL [Convivina sp. LMG 32447]CAH1851248.1 Inner membrane protein YbhL [Convivina sp. LMG 32447]